MVKTIEVRDGVASYDLTRFEFAVKECRPTLNEHSALLKIVRGGVA